MKEVKDNRGNKIGYIREETNGQVSVYDKNGRKIGHTLKKWQGLRGL